MFNQDRFDDEAAYGNREGGVELAQAHTGKTLTVPDGGQSGTLDYEP